MAALSSFPFPKSLQSPPKCRNICPPVPGRSSSPFPRLPQPGRQVFMQLTCIACWSLLICTGPIDFPPSFPCLHTLSRLSSLLIHQELISAPPSPSRRFPFSRALSIEADEHALECASLRFSRPIPTCNTEEAIQSAAATLPPASLQKPHCSPGICSRARPLPTH